MRRAEAGEPLNLSWNLQLCMREDSQARHGHPAVGWRKKLPFLSQILSTSTRKLNDLAASTLDRPTGLLAQITCNILHFCRNKPLGAFARREALLLPKERANRCSHDAAR
jgi:hypothetical protein